MSDTSGPARRLLAGPSPHPEFRHRSAISKGVAAAAILAGAALSIAIVVHVGWRPISSSFATLGWSGFAILCACTLGVFVLLGFSWFVIVPDLPARRLPAFVFGRLMREAVADILPFSQLSGFVVGARAASLLGAPKVATLASAIIDLAAEMVGQLLFTALGAALILWDAPSSFPHKLVDPILAVGLLGGGVVAVLFIVSQRMGLGLVARLFAGKSSAIGDQIAAVRKSLEDLYRPPARAMASAGLHLACWIATSASVWLVLRLIGAPLSPQAVVALETLVYLARSAAFFVPGAIGVFEGSYVLLGPMFGLSPEAALSLALIKRGRDLAIGLPVVLAWQTMEGRHLLRRGSTATRQPSRPRRESLGRGAVRKWEAAPHKLQHYDAET